MELRIDSSKSDGNGKEIYNKPEVQQLLKSIRVKSDYQAPEHDYITDSSGVMKIKKIASEINGWKIKQQHLTSQWVELEAKKDDVAKKPMKVALKIRSTKHNLEEVMAEDGSIKRGDHVYDQTVKIGDAELKTTSVDKQASSSRSFLLYLFKEGVVFEGMDSYPVDHKADFDVMFESVIKNLSVDKERANKYYTN